MDISLEKEIQQVRVIGNDRNYWFIRTYSGVLYNYFLENSFVGIGFNSVPMQYVKEAKYDDEATFNRLQKYLENNTSYKKAEATKWANQLIGFQQEVKLDDIVIIPSVNSDYLSIGIIESDVYAAKVNGTFKYKDKFESYPEKRRKVKWLKTIPRDEFRGALSAMFFSRTALKKVNDYSEIIEGNLSSLYIKNEQIYLSIKIDQDEDINAFHLKDFLESMTYLYKEFCRDFGYDDNEELYIKIKVQSKGGAFFRAVAIGAVLSLGGIIVLGQDKGIIEELRLAVEGGGALGLLTLGAVALSSNDPKVKIENKLLGKFEASSKGNFLQNLNEFFQAKHTREEERKDNEIKRKFEVLKLMESANKLQAHTVNNPVTKDQDKLEKPKD